MAQLVFYEKPGCAGNARQKAALRRAGHQLEVRDLLGWPWTRESLLAFLAPLPVADWFNRAAPAVKSGDVVPERLDREPALALLLASPILIRRPLIQAGERRHVGFETRVLQAWVGLDAAGLRMIEGCAMSGQSPSCRSATDESPARP